MKKELSLPFFKLSPGDDDSEEWDDEDDWDEDEEWDDENNEGESE